MPPEQRTETHEFRIAGRRLFPNDEAFDRLMDALYESGCDDAIVSLQRGVLSVNFAREASSVDEAIERASADVVRAGAEIIRVEREQIVAELKLDKETRDLYEESLDILDKFSRDPDDRHLMTIDEMFHLIFVLKVNGKQEFRDSLNAAYRKAEVPFERNP